MEPTMDIKPDDEYAIRSQTKEERDAISENEVPTYRVKLELSDDDEKRLKRQFFTEFKGLKEERKSLDLENKWDERQRQYDGLLRSNKRLAFNLHVHESKIKVDAIVRALNEAFLDSEPMVDVSPRPDSGRKNGFEIAEQQAEFLDFAIDEEVKPEPAFIKIARSAVMKFVGIGKLSWDYDVQKRRREEAYDGTPVPFATLPDGTVVSKNEGLEKFLQAYPDGMEKQKGYVRKLMEGKKINLVVEYKDTVKNNPILENIKLENFYVRNGCNYSDGLRGEHCTVERKEYTYWELKKKERDGEFKDVDKLWTTDADSSVDDNNNYMTKSYSVLEVTTYFEATEGDDEEIKIKAWFGEGEINKDEKGESDIEFSDKQVYLGGELYPYYGFDTDYIAFYVTLNEDGFYGDVKSVLYDLRDNNIAQDALLNLALHGTLVRNTLTPIVQEGSAIEEMFLDQQFEIGKPLPVDSLTDDVSKAMGFVEWPNVNMNDTLVLMEKLKRDGSDVTNVSDNVSGGESVLDPSAPAAKTIALLEQAGIGIRNYIRLFLPGFNQFASMLLQLYYQMSGEDKKYKVVGKASAITGDNPFKSITREDMVVKTIIQSRAASFAFDKANEKREALAAYQTVLADPYASRRPKMLYEALKTLLETFGPRWKAIVDTVFTSPEEFQQELDQAAFQAIGQLMQNAQDNANVTNVPPDQRKIMEAAPSVVGKAQADVYIPPEPEKK